MYHIGIISWGDHTPIALPGRRVWSPCQEFSMITIATFGQACHATTALMPAPEHAELAAGDPHTPFGVAGGPCHDIPVTDDALDRAFELLVSFYEHSPAIISRAERALAVAKDRIRCT